MSGPWNTFFLLWVETSVEKGVEEYTEAIA